MDRTILLPVVAVTLLAPPGHAQQRPPATVIPDTPTCATCRITQHQIATIRDDEFPGGALVDFATVHVNSDSTFIVVARTDPIRGEAYYADRSGRITRRIGATGSGPGEYRAPSFPAETPTSYVIMDRLLRRATTLSKRGLEFVSVVSLPDDPGPHAPLVYPDGSMLLHIDLRPREDSPEFHLLASDGSMIRSFGPSTVPDGEGPNVDALAASGDSAFWIAFDDEYRIELWSLEGRLLGNWERKPPWFRIGGPGAQPGDKSHSVYDVREDDAGRLWVLIRESTSAGYPYADPDPASRATIIEVLDPHRAELVATARRDSVRVWPVRGDGVFHSVGRVTNTGMQIDILAGPLEEGSPSTDRIGEDDGGRTVIVVLAFALLLILASASMRIARARSRGNEIGGTE